MLLREWLLRGYEIIVVDDGSEDRMVEVVLEFGRWCGLYDVFRVVSLEKNRGKGGSVMYGLRYVRGKYVVFVDVDGVFRFSDLGCFIEGCEDVVDGFNWGVVIGSRVYFVGSEVVVKRLVIWNFLMRLFYFVFMIFILLVILRIWDM